MTADGTMPDLIGMDFDAIAEAVEGEFGPGGYAIGISFQQSSKPYGTVIDQDPPPGSTDVPLVDGEAKMHVTVAE